MNHPLGPWKRSNVVANEGVAPMLYDSLTLPVTISSAGRLTGLILSTRPFATGSLIFHIEKDGVIVRTDVKTPTSPDIIDFSTTINVPKGSKVRLLMSTSSDLTPAGLDVLAWIEAP